MMGRSKLLEALFSALTMPRPSVYGLTALPPLLHFSPDSAGLLYLISTGIETFDAPEAGGTVFESPTMVRQLCHIVDMSYTTEHTYGHTRSTRTLTHTLTH